MAKEIVENYAFDPIAGTLEFLDEVTVNLEQILLIVDVTTGETLFDFSAPGLSGSIAGNVLTFEKDVSAIADTDKIQAWFWKYGIQEVSIDQIQALVAGIETDSMLYYPGRRPDAFDFKFSSADASVAAQIQAATAGKSIYITDIEISVDTIMNVKIQDNAGTPVVKIGPLYLPANSVWSKTYHTPKKLDTNTALMVKTSAAGNVSVTGSGYII